MSFDLAELERLEREATPAGSFVSAGRYEQFTIGDLRALAASCLAQDETPGKRARLKRGGEVRGLR